MHYDIDIFDRTKTAEFGEFLADLHLNIRPYARLEARNLAPIFEYALKIIQPHNDPEFPFQSVDALKASYVDIACAHRSMSFNDIIIVEDGLDYHDPPGQEIFVAYPIQKALTAYFGFLVSTGHKLKQTLIVPLVILPPEFLDVIRATDSVELLQQLGKITFYTNHDWFHTMLISSVNPAITKIPDTAPIKCLESNMLSYNINGINDYRHWHLREGEIYRRLMQNDNDGYEGWAMRFQKEILELMLAEPNNPLTKHVRCYLDLLGKFDFKTANYPSMSKPETTPLIYAIRLLAFTLLRAAPLQHPLLQEVLQHDSVMKHSGIFDDVYQNDVTRFLFENGTCRTSRQYKELVLRASSHAVGLAAAEATQALQIYNEQEIRRLINFLMAQENNELRIRTLMKVKNNPRDNDHKLWATAIENVALSHRIDLETSISQWSGSFLNPGTAYAEFSASLLLGAIYQFACKGQIFDPYAEIEFDKISAPGINMLRRFIAERLVKRSGPIAQILADKYPQYIAHWLQPTTIRFEENRALVLG